MPDMIQPVGAMIKPPDPSQAINTMSGILGLKQQRQALQTGQYQQDTAQATAQMTQQDASNRQAAGAFFKNFDIAKHHGDDGTLDLDSALTSSEFKATGDSAPEIAKNLLAIKNSQLAAKTSLAGLNKDLRGQFSSQVAGLAQDPDVKSGNQTGRGKVLDALEQFGEVGGPDAQRVAGIYGKVLQNTPPEKMAQALQNLQLQARSAGEQLPQTASMDTGGQIQPGAVEPGTGAFKAAGPPVKKTLAPTEQLPYVRARGAAGIEGTQGASNDEALYNDIVQKGTKAVQLKALTQDIRNLSNEVQTGQYSKAMADKWSALKQTFGFKPTDDSFETKRQVLAKMAAQLRTQSEAGASTDSERNGIASALPDPEHMGPAAVGQAARYVGALADTQAARAKFANQHRQVNGGTSTGIRESDSAFMQNADPRVFEYQSIPPGKERQDYLKQHFKSKDEAKAFLDKQQAMRSYGAIQ
jgi:hypothetical protein